MKLARRGVMFCLVGPAGSGKTTLVERLIKEFGSDLHLSVSVTSRSPRPNEVDGVHYHYVGPAEFQRKVNAGDFFEWEETHGNFYGTLRSTLDAVGDGGTDLLLEVDIRGAMRFKQAYPKETVIVFILPPSLSVLRDRITGRSKVDEEELNRRLMTAEKEGNILVEQYGGPQGADYIVVNEEIDSTYQEVRSILIAERASSRRIPRQEVANLCGVKS